MKTNKIYSITLLSALVLLTACNKNVIVPAGQTTTPANNPAAMQLIKIEQDAGNYSTYGYNAEGLLATTTNFHNQVGSSFNTTYGTNKKPVSVTVDDEIYKIIYTGDKISKIEAYEKQDPTGLVAYFTYIYTGDKVTEADYYSMQAVNTYGLVAKTISTYNTAGDMDTQKIYFLVGSGFQLSSNSVYEYDNKINPLATSFNFASILVGPQPLHNITKQTIYDNANNIDETDTYTITYNSSNYPTLASCKKAKPGMPDVIAISKFTYK